MPNQTPKNILLAPLDWGAGHTTRCIPIVAHLLTSGNRVFFAGNDWQITLIKQVFGNQVTTLPLYGYNITYSRLNHVLQLGLLSQLPRLLQVIKAEHNWLLQTVRAHNIQGVISDNRYGLHHPTVPSVIITHQLHILTGAGSMADAAVQQLHYRYLHRFREVWIPDTEQQPSLAGRLSHPESLPHNSRYIGWLSRFVGKEATPEADSRQHLLVLLSGPEPLRTHTSQRLWQQALSYKGGRVVFADGSDAATAPASIPSHISYHRRLNDQELIAAVGNAHTIVCRSGYSTVMDLVAMGARAILLPTPAQTEQQYLGKYLRDKRLFYSVAEKDFDLNIAMENYRNFDFSEMPSVEGFCMHQQAVNEWIATL